jgi:hypothetical protein
LDAFESRVLRRIGELVLRRNGREGLEETA